MTDHFYVSPLPIFHDSRVGDELTAAVRWMEERKAMDSYVLVLVCIEEEIEQ